MGRPIAVCADSVECALTLKMLNKPFQAQRYAEAHRSAQRRKDRCFYDVR